MKNREQYKGIYVNWIAMKQRCLNQNTVAYKNYGGRGIEICEKWLSFKGFKEDMNDGYRKGLTLERIDNGGNYCKENCKWATRTEQANNKRNNQILDFNGKKQTFSQWAEEIGMSRETLRNRFYRGMTTDKILKKELYRPATIN